MYFNQLVKILSQTDTIHLINNSSSISFSDIAFLDGNELVDNEKTLYFGFERQLNIKNIFPMHCILGTEAQSINSLNLIDDLALVTETSLFAVFNRTKLILEQSEGKGLYEELIRKSEESHDIQAVVNASAVKLGNPLILIDLDFKVIVYSTISPITDELWRKNVERGYCSYEFIKTTLSMKELQNPSYPTDPVEVSCTESPYRKLCNRIFFRGAHVGYALMIASETNLTPSHFSMMTTISQAISHILANDFPALFQQSSQYQKVLYNLLIGALPEELSPELNTLTFAPHMAALAIKPERYYGSDYIKKCLTPVIRQKFPNVHMTYYDALIAVLFPFNKTVDITETDLNQLNDIAKTENLIIGISNTFSRIGHFALHYAQAKAAIQLGERLSPKQCIYKYLDYQFYDLLSQIPSNSSIGKYCHPALTLLRKYDNDNATNLYYTLRAYLESGCNIKLTASNLFIHRNSMIYRLERIEEIGRIDIRNIDTLFLLQISYAIDRFLERDA